MCRWPDLGSVLQLVYTVIFMLYARVPWHLKRNYEGHHWTKLKFSICPTFSSFVAKNSNLVQYYFEILFDLVFDPKILVHKLFFHSQKNPSIQILFCQILNVHDSEASKLFLDFLWWMDDIIIDETLAEILRDSSCWPSISKCTVFTAPRNESNNE